MRIIIGLTALITFISSIYKWRYSILNVLMSIKWLRKTLVRASLKIPTLRQKI